MHGTIFAELKKYLDANAGPGAWGKVLADAGLDGSMYLPVNEYPDRDAAAIIGAACRITGRSAGDVLEDFGAFIVPDLLRMYGSLLDPEWKTLDVIEHTEDTIHRVVRMKQPGAKPPEINCTRARRNEVVIEYRSARRLCGIAKGIARGLATHFDETAWVRETSCMNEGAPKCLISVRVNAR